MTKSEIDNSYTHLWSRFSNLCSGSNFKVRPRDSIGYTSRFSESGVVEVTALIYLINWRYKSSSEKPIDILVKSSETFSCQPKNMTSSTVQVMYLKNQSNKAVPLLAVHYDFKIPVDKAHPVFHVQLGTTKIEADDMKAIQFRSTVQKPEAPLYGNLRIPTPYMNLSSVLLGLAADHLPHEKFEAFLSELRSNDGITWNASCNNLQTSLTQKGGFLHAHHWY